MGFFGKKKKTALGHPPSAKDANGNAATHAKTSTKKKKSTPLKKIKKLFKKRNTPAAGEQHKKKLTFINRSPQRKKNSNKLTLVSPEVRGDINNYYSNDTDGFEVILDGQRLQYEANAGAGSPERHTDIDDCNTCGAGQACSPLSDWNNFVSLLVAPNLDEIQKFVFGDSSSVAPDALRDSQSTERMSPRSGGRHGRSGKHSSPRGKFDSPAGSLPFDELKEYNNDGIIRRRDDIVDDQQQETVEIQHFSTASSHVRSPQRPIGSGKPLTPPKLTDQLPMRPLSTMSARLRKTNLPDEEVYDTAFTLQFLKEVSKIGVIMTYFKVPNDDQEIISHVVSLKIQPGLARGSRLLEPKLTWTDINDINVDKTGSSPGRTTSESASGSTGGTFISLLGIHSIHTSLGGSEDDETPFFTITTETGEVHAFESPTLAERNYIVHGIKNVVAWLSYHLVMGNMATGTELVSDLDEARGEISGELPSLKTPVQAMNELSHQFLD